MLMGGRLAIHIPQPFQNTHLMPIAYLVCKQSFEMQMLKPMMRTSSVPCANGIYKAQLVTAAVGESCRGHPDLCLGPVRGEATVLIYACCTLFSVSSSVHSQCPHLPVPYARRQAHSCCCLHTCFESQQGLYQRCTRAPFQDL